MSLRQTIVSQFERPRGLLGRLAGWILANRGSNLARNTWTVEQLALGPSDRVLEIGCGPGVALALCLARGNGVSAVGVDHSALMIRQAGKRNRAALKAKRLTLVEGTLETLPESAGPFDRVFSINVIQFVDDKRAFVQRAARLMKPGAVFATTYQPRNAKATRDQAQALAAGLSEMLSSEGFGEVRTEELALRPVPAVCVIARRR